MIQGGQKTTRVDFSNQLRRWESNFSRNKGPGDPQNENAFHSSSIDFFVSLVFQATFEAEEDISGNFPIEKNCHDTGNDDEE